MNDPLDELRAAWRDMDAAPPSDDLGRADPGTREAVDWLQRAYRIDPPAPPPAMLRRLERRRRPRRTWLRLVPALALSAAAVLVWVLRPPALPAAEPDLPQVSVDSPQIGQAPGVDALAAADTRVSVPPERFRSRTDGIEMTAGKVRLVLVKPIASASFRSSGDSTTEEILR